MVQVIETILGIESFPDGFEYVYHVLSAVLAVGFINYVLTLIIGLASSLIFRGGSD